MQRRRTFLRHLWEEDISQYQEFTAMVNRYYARPDEVMDQIAAAEGGGEEAPTVDAVDR